MGTQAIIQFCDCDNFELGKVCMITLFLHKRKWGCGGGTGSGSYSVWQ